MSSNLNNLGQGHTFSAVVAADGESMTSNDGSASIATNGAGDFTITFGQAFLSAPIVVAQVVDATDSTDAAHSAAVVVAATGSVQIQTKTTVTNGTATEILSSLADLVCNVIAVGSRNI